MRAKLFQNLSANTLQLLINQLCGLVIFYLLSTRLDKSGFGQLNLALAIMLVAFNLLSFGIDQVTVRKVAMGGDAGELLSLYLGHVLITGILFYAILLLCSIFIPLHTDRYAVLLVIGAGKLMIYFSTPFKQVAGGLEKFRTQAGMLVVCNVTRTLVLIALALFHSITLQSTLLAFAFGDLMECIACIWLFRSRIKVPVSIRWQKMKYLQLLKEALPQTGVVIITSAIARFDWIFIGVMLSSVKLAEYSFAYKVFEISTLPLLAIAPLLLPWLTRTFRDGQADADSLGFLMRMEFVVAVLTGLVLNILWVPVVDLVTAGKYGAVNVHTIFLLSLCIPFLYLNNFLWTIYFAQGRMRMILTGFILTFSVNVSLDLLLIPYFKNEGAAIAFLGACAAQTVFYLRQGGAPGLGHAWQGLLTCMACALLSGFVAARCFTGYPAILAFALLVCTVLLVLTGQLRPKDQRLLNAIFNSR